MKVQEGIDLLSKGYGRTIKENDDGIISLHFLHMSIAYQFDFQITKRRG